MVELSLVGHRCRLLLGAGVKGPEAMVIEEAVYYPFPRGDDGLIPMHAYHLFRLKAELTVRGDVSRCEGKKGCR